MLMGEYQQRTIVQLRKDFKNSEAEVERLKENHVINVKEAWSLGMERAAVIFDVDGSKMVSRAWAAAAIRAKIKT